MTATEPAEKIDSKILKLHKEFGIEEAPTNEEAKAALIQKYTGLPDANTKDGYEAHRIAIGELTKIRTSIEKRRKELKADSLEYGRRIDSFAKDCTSIIEQLEIPLRTAKQLIDTEKERKQKAAEEAERLEVEQKAKEERDAEEARLKAIRDAENEKNRQVAAKLKEIEDAQKAAQAKLDAERAELDRQRQAMAAEQERVAKAQEVERQRLERIEFERQASIKAEQEAKERLERERIESEKRAAEKAKSDEEAAKLRALVMSDAEKMEEYIKKFSSFPTWPSGFKTRAATVACKVAYDAVIAAGKQLEKFGK